MAKLRAAIITDIHYGPDSGAKLGSKAPRLLDKFAKAAGKFKADALIDMGDRVTAGNAADAGRNMRAVKDHFNKVAAESFSIQGNHDLKYLTRAENEAITGSPAACYSRDVGGYHLVFWNADVDPDKNEGLHASQADIDWLEADLKATDKPAIVFSHVPLDNDEADNERIRKLRGNDTTPFFYPEAPAIRDVMEKSGKVVLCMAGHIHRNRHREVNGIHYVIQHSLVHKWQDKYRVPMGAFSLLEADDQKITIRLQGKVKNIYELTPRPVS